MAKPCFFDSVQIEEDSIKEQILAGVWSERLREDLLLLDFKVTTLHQMTENREMSGLGEGVS